MKIRSESLTWKWTNFAKLGSLMKVSCKYAQINLTSRMFVSASVSPASSIIWTAALSWAAIKAIRNSSRSMSFVTWDDWDLSMMGFSCKCRVSMVREAAKQAFKIYSTISKMGAHPNTRRSHRKTCKGSMIRSSYREKKKFLNFKNVVGKKGKILSYHLPSKYVQI